ncbi:MAG: HigA family addiction module antidote protein [Desulfobacterales bacterium]|nr:HigA family addiction module antidote protein [Desulfobacterales bacterium]
MQERKIKPTHPGEMLREDFMPDFGLTTSELAKALGVSRQTVNEVLHERRAISPSMALRLSKLFGNTPEFWLNAQRALDLWNAEKDFQKDLELIKPLNAA